MRRSVIVVLASFVPFLITVNAIAKTAAEIFEKTSRSVVVVKIQNEKGKITSFGSGVILPDGDVVTNCHVIENASNIKVYQGEKEYLATQRYNDWDRDVCSLSVPGMKAPGISMGSTKTLKIGSRIYAIGTPKGLELTLSEGIISSLRPVAGGQYLQITAPISSGSSGGGLFDEEGRLIGLTTFYIAEGQQLNFAVPVEWISELAKRNKMDIKATETFVDWLKHATVLEKKNNWNDMINHAIQRTRTFPQDSGAWYVLGFAYDKLGHTAKAIEAYLQALRIDPNFAESWYILGVAYNKLGHTAKAFEAYQQVLHIDPHFAKAWCGLGSIYCKSGQIAQGIEALEKALRIDPDLAEAWNNLGSAYSLVGQASKAIKAYQQALRINPDFAMAWNNLGSEYYNMLGQTTEAIEAYQQALRINPNFAEAWYNLGLAFKTSGQASSAKDIYARLKSIDPTMAEKYFNNILLP